MTRWSARQIFGAALGAWLVVAILAWIAGPPLGHDEAAYALSARGDAPAWNYRSSGMIWIARVGTALGGSGFALRFLPVVLGAGVIVAVYSLGSVAFDRRTGAWAAAVIAGAHHMAAHSAELIGDLPATACLLAGCGVLLDQLERDRVTWKIVGAAPLLAAAFYIRYGSAPVIAMIAVLSVVLYAKKLARIEVLVTALAFAACLVPHIAHSITTTGSPLGILRGSAAMPRRAYVGEGLVTYVTANPFVFYGAIVAPVMLAALAGLLVTRVRRTQLFIALLAVGQLVSLGIESHAQPRYVFFATALLVIAGVDAIRNFSWPEWLAPVATGLAWLGLAIGILPFQRYVTDLRTPLYAAADTIRTDAHGQRCAVAANVVPQLMWATGCAVIVAHSAPDVASPWPSVDVKYVVAAPHASVPQYMLDAVAATAHATPHELAVANPAAHVWRLE